MKRLFHAFAMCQSMFCAIPFPGRVWNEKARSAMLLFLPVVGLEIGALWAGLGWLVRYFKLPTMAGAFFLCAFPFLVTGFLHLDGFMDVVDAVKSWRDLERRRQILKDSHVGAFGVIACVLLLLGQFAFFASAKGDAALPVLVLIPVVSRCCSALAVKLLPPMSISQYAGQERNKGDTLVLAVMLVAAGAAGAVFCGKYVLALPACALGSGLGILRGYRSLKGMNGDISGFALTVGELCAVAVYGLL